MTSSPHKTILLTGGAGFIGSSLTAALVARGDKVIVLDKLTYAGHPQNLSWIDKKGWPGSYELVAEDIANTAVLELLFSRHRPDAVIHAAAESHVDNSISGSALFIETNVVGTHRLLEATRRAWGKLAPDAAKRFRFLQVSTDEVYGALGDKGAFSTDAPMLPNSPYAASKASADHLARAWFKTYGLPVIITRCCNNYGPRQHPEKLIPRMITAAVAGQKLPVYGDGRQVREWLHVDDHAKGVLAALDKGMPGGLYHLGSGKEWRNIELVEMLCDLLASIRPGDYRPLISHVADRLGHDYRYALDITASYKLLGFSPSIPFTQGLKDTLQWYLDNPVWIDTMIKHTEAQRSIA